MHQVLEMSCERSLFISVGRQGWGGSVNNQGQGHDTQFSEEHGDNAHKNEETIDSFSKN